MIIAARGGVAAGASEFAYRWVAVGNGGELRTCDDTTGTTWTLRTSSFGTTTINSVASNGTSLYVAVGNAGKLATSPDGINWTQRTSSFGASDIYGVAYGSDGYWVAAGASGKIATSTDGITWTQQTSGTGLRLNEVAFGNNLYIVTIYGSGGNVLTATDPTSTWTNYTTTISGIPLGPHYDPTIGSWVIGRDSGTTGALAYSSNGTSWTARTSTISAQLNPFITSYYEQITVSNGSVIVGATVTNWNTNPWTIDFESSTNGTSWTNRTPADTSDNISCAASDNLGNMMIGGTSAQVSSDGITWSLGGAMGGALGLCHSSGTPSIR